MKPKKQNRDLAQINPDLRFVWLLNFAIDSVAAKLGSRRKYAGWLNWAASWKRGIRSPQACVDVAHECFAHKENPVWHALGQLAWGAKECCYSSSQSGWLVVRYIADAMIAFGVACPDERIAQNTPEIDQNPASDLETLKKVNLIRGL